MKNYVAEGNILDLTNGSGSAWNSGDPVLVGQLAGVAALNIANGASGAVSVKGVFDLSVKAIDAGGNSAVAVGDAIYYTAGDTPKLNKKATGVLFGHALEAIASGGTDTINVRLKH
jgi:T5SS/PEP-CTERM-associated repeat protein